MNSSETETSSASPVESPPSAASVPAPTTPNQAAAGDATPSSKQTGRKRPADYGKSDVLYWSKLIGKKIKIVPKTANQPVVGVLKSFTMNELELQVGNRTVYVIKSAIYYVDESVK